MRGFRSLTLLLEISSHYVLAACEGGDIPHAHVAQIQIRHVGGEGHAAEADILHRLLGLLAVDSAARQSLRQLGKLIFRDLYALDAQTLEILQVIQGAEIPDGIVVKIQVAQPLQRSEGREIHDLIPAEVQRDQPAQHGKAGDVAQGIVRHGEAVEGIELRHLVERRVPQVRAVQHQPRGRHRIVLARDAHGLRRALVSAQSLNLVDAGGDRGLVDVHHAQDFQRLGIIALVLIAVRHEIQTFLRLLDGGRLAQDGERPVIVLVVIQLLRLVHVVVVAAVVGDAHQHDRHRQDKHGRKNHDDQNGALSIRFSPHRRPGRGVVSAAVIIHSFSRRSSPRRQPPSQAAWDPA